MACLPRGRPGHPRRFLGSDHADPGRAGPVGPRGGEARRLGRERAGWDGQVDRSGHERGDHDDPGREQPDGARRGRRQRLGGKHRGRDDRPDRRAPEPRHREGRGRRQPAGVGGRRRQSLGQRPDTSACSTERGNRRRERPLVRDHARPCGRVQRRREPGRVRNLRVAAQLSRRAWRGRSAPRSRCGPRPSHREQGRPLVHVHDPSRHALLTTVEPAGHGADVQVHDRTQPQPADGLATGSDVPPRCRRRPRVHGRQGPPPRRGRGAGRPAHDSPRSALPTCRPGSPPSCSAPSRPTRRSGPFPERSPPQGRTTSPRRHRDEASSCSATPTTTATARTGCSGSRSSSVPRTRSRRSRRRSSTTRSAAIPAGESGAARTPLRRAQRPCRRGRQRYFVNRTLEVDYPRPEHQTSALRERAHAPRGELRHRPSRARGDRRQPSPPQRLPPR